MALFKENPDGTCMTEEKRGPVMMDITDDPPKELVISDTKSWSCTEIKLLEFRFNWIIENFSLLPVDVNCPAAIECQPFAVGKYRENFFIIRMYPMGKKEKCKNHIALYLGLYVTTFRPEGLFVKFKMLIKNSKHEVIRSRSTEGVFHAGTFKGWGNFINRKDLLDESLKSDDQLIIQLELCYSNGDIHTLSLGDSREKRNDSETDLPLLRLSKDFKDLLNNKTQSDLTLLVQGEPIQVHKAILFARSPVFQTLFEHEMEGTKQDHLDLKACSSRAVVEAMLRFIYTGSPGEMTDPIAENLLVAADKYALPRLKIMCADYMIMRIRVENAASMLVLADECRCNEMKEHALVFIKGNWSYVRQSESWKAMLNSKPQLVQEVIKYLIGTGLR